MENIDNLDEIMTDAPTKFIDGNIDENQAILEKLSKESNKELYPDCSDFTKIKATFWLYNLKAKNNWSGKSFTELLKLLIKMLPGGNKFPDSTYHAMKLLCPLSMEVKKIHECPNDCILFRNE